MRIELQGIKWDDSVPPVSESPQMQVPTALAYRPLQLAVGKGARERYAASRYLIAQRCEILETLGTAESLLRLSHVAQCSPGDRYGVAKVLGRQQ